MRVEWLGDDGRYSRYGAHDELFESSDGVDLLEQRSSAHRVL